jgi:S-adenosylmethionine/arginine decarboxylase-like enzyme
MTWWGTELTLDCGKCDPKAIRDPYVIEMFVKELVVAIDMKAYGPPQIVHFGTEDKMGYTLVQLIETSNITAHYSEDTDSAFINVFSCRKFDPQIVGRVVLDYFKPRLITMKMNERLIPI